MARDQQIDGQRSSARLTQTSAGATLEFSAEEVAAVRNADGRGPAGIPARCYYDEEIYRFEVEHILKKNWLCVGRWDWVEKPGDYFTTQIFGEPLVIVRDQAGSIHALINVCQHRWSKVAQGRGNVRLFMCPYHRWTYNLNGTLRGISAPTPPYLAKETCRMPPLRVEIWQGFIFINFDADAEELAPRLAPLSERLDRYGISEFRHVGTYEYDAPWNWKLSFENGYEGYHDVGLHHDSLEHILPGAATFAEDFGELFGTYRGPAVSDHIPELFLFPPSPRMTEDDKKKFAVEHTLFAGIYPSLVMFANWEQLGFIVTEHQSATHNQACTSISNAPFCFEHSDFEQLSTRTIEIMKQIQDEDSAGCANLQRGITSRYNKRSIIHPLERQLSHFHNWLMDRYLNGARTPAG
jgi:phenylpropionate dioxygenase-like ring-hydroxylating dioxygenase large terminal subunit